MIHYNYMVVTILCTNNHVYQMANILLEMSTKSGIGVYIFRNTNNTSRCR